MNRSLWLLAPLALLPAAGSAPAQETAREIVERAVKAHGGMDRLAKVRADRVKVKGVVFAGDEKHPVTVETFVQLPGQYKSVIQMTGKERQTTIVQAIDGDTSWVTLDGKPQTKVPAAALAELKAARYLDGVVRLVPLLTDKRYELMALGASKVNGRAVLGVGVLCKGQREVRLYFDKETGLLAKTEQALEVDRDKEVHQEAYYTDYKDFAGYKRPTRMTVYRDGKKTQEAELVEVRYYEKMDKKVFAKP
jgi:hypothetical protein